VTFQKPVPGYLVPEEQVPIIVAYHSLEYKRAEKYQIWKAEFGAKKFDVPEVCFA
jgi:hypothetical protein